MIEAHSLFRHIVLVCLFYLLAVGHAKHDLGNIGTNRSSVCSRLLIQPI